MNALQKFDQYLRFELKLPVSGVGGVGADCEIFFLPEATDEQKQQALDARKTFEFVDDPPPPEYVEKRKVEYAQQSIETQLDALYHFCKNMQQYIKDGGITPDIKKPIGTPEGWIAWQDAIREKYPKP